MSIAVLLVSVAVIAWFVLSADRQPSSVGEAAVIPSRSSHPVDVSVLPTPAVGGTKEVAPTAAQQPSEPKPTVSESREPDVAVPESDRELTVLYRVTGIVRVTSGAMRDVPMIDMSEDPMCNDVVNHEMVPAPWGVHVDAANGLADVFVELLDVPQQAGMQAATGPSVVIKVCAIQPLITVARIGQDVTFVNKDATLHLVRVKSSANGSWLWASPERDLFRSMPVSTPECGVQVSCEVHKWEHGYICVAGSGYYGITDESGKYSIDTTGLADGTYSIRMWHSVLGTRAGQVRLERGQATFDFEW